MLVGWFLLDSIIRCHMRLSFFQLLRSIYRCFFAVLRVLDDVDNIPLRIRLFFFYCDAWFVFFVYYTRSLLLTFSLLILQRRVRGILLQHFLRDAWETLMILRQSSSFCLRWGGTKGGMILSLLNIEFVGLVVVWGVLFWRNMASFFVYLALKGRRYLR